MVVWKMQCLFTSRLRFLEGKRTITVIKASRQNASTRIFASESRRGNVILRILEYARMNKNRCGMSRNIKP